MPDGPHARTAVEWIRQRLAAEIAYVGKTLTRNPGPPDAAAIPNLLRDVRLLVDCEILLASELKLNPIQLFRTLARKPPRIVVWPGPVHGRCAVFSQPGRADYFEEQLTDAIVLRAIETRFPDEVPYEVERIP